MFKISISVWNYKKNCFYSCDAVEAVLHIKPVRYYNWQNIGNNIRRKNTNQTTAPNSGIQMSWFCKEFVSFYTILDETALLTFLRQKSTYISRSQYPRRLPDMEGEIVLPSATINHFIDF